MPSTHKKVVVRKMDRDSINGHVAPSNFVREGKLELLNTSGTVVAIDLRDIKAVYFVREFSDSDSLTRKTFTTRPRTEGLWVRLKFKDNEVLEGMMQNDLSLTTAEGFLINPPGPAIQHAENFRPSHRSGVANRTGSDRRNPSPPQRRPSRIPARSQCLESERADGGPRTFRLRTSDLRPSVFGP